MAVALEFVILGVFYCLAMLFTLFRVGFRLWIGRFWWEDAWAVAVIIFGTLSLSVLYVYELSSDPTVMFASELMFLNCRPAVIWAVRLSLLASVIRIVQPGRLRVLMLAVGWFFVAVYLLLAVPKTYRCVGIYEQFLHGLRKSFACSAVEVVAIGEVIADIVADAILVVLPLRVLWGIRLERRQRRMIMLIFISSAAVTVVSVIHSVAEVVPEMNPWQEILAMLEVIVSLVVCNLLVIITLIYRRFIKEPTGNIGVDTHTDSDSSDDDFTQPRTRSTGHTAGSGTSSHFLTTVELSISSSWRTLSEPRGVRKENDIVTRKE